MTGQLVMCGSLLLGLLLLLLLLLSGPWLPVMFLLQQLPCPLLLLIAGNWAA
jgi:hypothetical protein